jgi:molybdopterin-guanine dinucleotide biosynthesis protein MobB
MDREGTNTWRYAEAGCKVVVAISPTEIDIIRKTQRELNDLDKILGLLEKEKLDIIFIEGFHSVIAKRVDVPKIVTAKDMPDLERTLHGTVPPILAATGVVAENSTEESFGEIPMIKVPKDGEKLVKLIRCRLDASL